MLVDINMLLLMEYKKPKYLTFSIQLKKQTSPKSALLVDAPLNLWNYGGDFSNECWYKSGCGFTYGSGHIETLNNVDEIWVALHFIWSNIAQRNHKDQEKSMKNKQEIIMSVMRTWNATNLRRNPKIAFNGS